MVTILERQMWRKPSAKIRCCTCSTGEERISEQRRVNYQGIMNIMAMENLSKKERKAMIKALPRVQQSSKAPYNLYPQTQVKLPFIRTNKQTRAPVMDHAKMQITDNSTFYWRDFLEISGEGFVYQNSRSKKKIGTTGSSRACATQTQLEMMLEDVETELQDCRKRS